MLMTILKKAWNTWKRISQRVGDFVARAALSLFYFTVCTPFALAVRLFQDPLRQEAGKCKSHWEITRVQTDNIDDARRGF